MRACILDSKTKECVKIILLDSLDQYIQEDGLELSSDHTGQVGWSLIDDEWIKPTQTLTDEQLEIAVRRKRNVLLKKTVDSLNPIRWETMDAEEKDAWITYRQALLDIPQQTGFPKNIIWPNKPE